MDGKKIVAYLEELGLKRTELTLHEMMVMDALVKEVQGEEREACAKIADAEAQRQWHESMKYMDGYNAAALGISEAIRARGK